MCAFFCLHRTCYIYLSFSFRPCVVPAGAWPPEMRYPEKRRNLDPLPSRVIVKEECNGTQCPSTGNRSFSKALSSKWESLAAATWDCRWRCASPKQDTKSPDLIPILTK